MKRNRISSFPLMQIKRVFLYCIHQPHVSLTPFFGQGAEDYSEGLSLHSFPLIRGSRKAAVFLASRRALLARSILRQAHLHRQSANSTGQHARDYISICGSQTDVAHPG